MLNYILVYINIILINVLILNCYNITNYGFYTLNFLVLASMLLYYIFSQIIKKIPRKIFKFLFVMAFLGSVAYVVYLNREIMYEFILDLNNKALYLISAIYAKRIIDFNDISSLWFIILPFIVWLFMIICNKNLQILLFLITIALGVYLNYAGFRPEFINNINLFTFIMIFNIVVIYFIRRYLKNIENENKLEVNYRSILFIGIFVFLSFAVFLIFNSSSASMRYELNIANLGSNLSTDIRDLLKIADTKKVIGQASTSLIAFNNDEVLLGGDLKLNNSTVLTVKTDGPIKYLRARTRDYYTGNSWRSTYKNFSTKESDILVQYPPALIDAYSAMITLSQYGNRRLAAPLYSFGYDNDNIRYNINDFTCESNNINNSYSFNYYTDGFLFDDDYIGEERRYLQLPPNVSENIVALTNEIVKDAVNNEDKINKIVNYLRTNCKYSLTVGQVPKDREFVDYFVNTSKKGYCTYFATSAVVMLRTVGIEARYVEGYMVKSNLDENGAYIVTNKDAHAWAEAKIGNNTWITVDAVPEVESLDTQYAEDNTPVQLSPIEEEEQYANKTSALRQDTTSEQLDTPASQSDDFSSFNLFEIISELKWYFKAPLILILILVLFILCKHLIFNYKRNKFINSQNINYCHIYFINNLNKIGYKKNKDETNLEFSETIEDEDIKDTFLSFIYNFNREVYGNKNINFSKEDRIKLFEYINEFYINNTKLYQRILSF